MDLRPGIQETAQRLSRFNLSFLHYVAENPQCLEESHFQHLLQWRDPTVIGALHCWPVFISRATEGEFERASVQVFNLVKAIPEKLFCYDSREISRYYGLEPEAAKRCLGSFPRDHGVNFLGRGDFILSASGLKCIEFNGTSSLGGMQFPFWEPMILQTPLLATFFQNHRVTRLNRNLIEVLIQHLVDNLRQRFPGERELNTAFLIRERRILELMAAQGGIIDRIYGQVLAQRGRDENLRLEGRVRFVLPDQLDITGDYLYHGGRKVLAFLDNNETDLPQALLEVSRQGNVLIYNGPVSAIMSSKLNMALLSEHEESELFTSAERQIIKTYIPWTRRLRPVSTTFQGEKIDLEQFVLTHREQLVLKPSTGYGGKGVHVGLRTAAEPWQEFLSEAFRQGLWVVQERVEALPLLLQWGERGCVEHDSVWGMYVFGTRYGGVWLRVLPRFLNDGVINAHKGARSPLVFTVEE
jgi:hypothetical protein